jgi:hypothetical protein
MNILGTVKHKHAARIYPDKLTAVIKETPHREMALPHSVQ